MASAMISEHSDEGSAAANEFLYTIKGCERMMTDARGKLWVLSEPFTSMGLTWQLQVYPQVREQDGVKFSFWLVLLDVELLAAEDLPFVRCSMTVINQVDRSRDVPSMMNAQYTHVSNTNRARRLLASMAHSRLKDMREELMPGGDLRLLVRVDRLMPARQRAALRKCTVHDLLTGLDGKPDSGASTPPVGPVNCLEVANWVAGGSQGLGALETAVRNAIAGNVTLCQRVRPHQAEGLGGGDEFVAALRAVRGMLRCKGATAEVLEYFGGDKAHAALVTCLAVDPAGLLRHISAAVGPKTAGRSAEHGDDSRSGGRRPPLAKRILHACRGGA